MAALAGCRLERDALGTGKDPNPVEDASAPIVDTGVDGPSKPPREEMDAASSVEADAMMSVDTIEAGLTDAGDSATLEADADGGMEPEPDPEPTESFGLSCGATRCPSVTLPAEQCCTADDDAVARRARQAGRCGILRKGIEGCFELEQLGVLDDACPKMTPEGATSEEPGCCTSAGRCGSFDIANNLGCHENADVDSECGQDVIEPETVCEATGVYAIEAQVDVTWGGRSGGLWDITDDGRGKIAIAMRAVIDEIDVDNHFSGTLVPCDVRLPPFYSSVLCESYQPTFPTTIWDDGAPPELAITGSFQCLNPGCIMTFDPVTGPVGIELNDPDGAWPTASQADSFSCPSGKGDVCFPDVDLDGRPGVTVRLPRSGSTAGYGDCSRGFDVRAPPLNSSVLAIFDGVRRSDRLHLGVRIRLGASSRLADDCSAEAGAGVADFVQSRAASCMVEPGTRNGFQTPAGLNQLCSADETLFMNQNLPNYAILRVGAKPSSSLDLEDTSPSDGPRFRVVRLGALDVDATCADVRGVLQP